MNLTHDSIIVFDDVEKHLDLEDEHLETYRASGHVDYTWDAGPSQAKHDNKKDKNFFKKVNNNGS